MPELPEVEVVRKYLEKEVTNEIISKVFLHNKKSLRNATEEDLWKIESETIVSMERKAKHLIMRLSNHYLIMHLRMEGKFYIFNSLKEMHLSTNRFYDVLEIRTNSKIILFQDVRRFATIDIFKNSCLLKDNPILSKVADEPFTISEKIFYEKISKKKTAIKVAILDQGIISGIGNIYADEILFDNNIHPETISSSLTRKQTNSIINSAKIILTESIKKNGTTIKNYTSSLGVEGSYQNFLTVHQRKGMPCIRHPNQLIIKLKVGGRGTYICPLCQKID